MRFLIALIFSFSIDAKLLDKTMAVINNEVITLSQVQRIKESLGARKNIIPQIYKRTNLSIKEIVKLKVRRIIIREKLTEVGFVISDESVEKTILNREKSLGITRRDLIQFLRANKLTFDEYFELTREAQEYNRFNSWIIQPLVSITDQEIKNQFYKNNIKNKTLNYKYNLVDFSLEKKLFKKGMLKRFKSVLLKLQKTGVTPKNFSQMETNNIDEITEDGLTKPLKRVLQKTKEGEFSKPVLIGGSYHIFFIKERELVESEIFSKQKNFIRNQLFAQSAGQVADTWFENEKTKHYIKYFFKK